LYLYGNKLTGIVPPLPFEQYNGSCALDRPGNCTEPDCNHFKCPLPTNSDQCKDSPWGGVHCLGQCVGSSSTLTAAQCIAWQELFDSTNGREWTQCSDSRLDPCSCGGASCDPAQGTGGNYCVKCVDGDLTQVVLAGNGLVGTITAAIGSLQELTVLNLGSQGQGLANNLEGTIPSTIGTLNKLQFLRLYQNHLSGSIPTELGLLKDLTYLALGLNKLTGIIPPLPFAQYTVSCCLDWHSICTEPYCNHFKCPLPPNSDQCKNQQHSGPTIPGVHCE
jgi:hypothetical protein